MSRKLSIFKIFIYYIIKYAKKLGIPNFFNTFTTYRHYFHFFRKKIRDFDSFR